VTEPVDGTSVAWADAAASESELDVGR
jgi:hypothetical protein